MSYSCKIAWELGVLDWQQGYGQASIGWELGYKESDVGAQSDDLDAINAFFMSSDAVTPQAVTIKDEWVTWFNQLSWWDKTFDGNTYDMARNRRNQYNLANAVSAAEKAQVKNVMKTGLSSEQMQGAADRRLSSGMMPEYVQLLSTPAKIIIGAVAAVAVVAAAYATPKAAVELLSHHTPKEPEK